MPGRLLQMFGAACLGRISRESINKQMRAAYTDHLLWEISASGSTNRISSRTDISNWKQQKENHVLGRAGQGPFWDIHRLWAL